jgi:hypothetical protein
VLGLQTASEDIEQEAGGRRARERDQREGIPLPFVNVSYVLILNNTVYVRYFVPSVLCGLTTTPRCQGYNAVCGDTIPASLALNFTPKYSQAHHLAIADHYFQELYALQQAAMSCSSICSINDGTYLLYFLRPSFDQSVQDVRSWHYPLPKTYISSLLRGDPSEHPSTLAGTSLISHMSLCIPPCHCTSLT